MNDRLIADIVEWDIPNWWRAIQFWEETVPLSDLKGKKVLDIGARNGGVSLLFALKGATVTCSDINEDFQEKASALHKKYGVEQNVHYEVIDAADIPYIDEFDIICFKSVMGGVGGHDNYENQLKMMHSIHCALRDGGVLLFAENLKASAFHQMLREHVKRGKEWRYMWRYIHIDEVPKLTAGFSDVKYKTFGFFGIFGKTNILMKLTGLVDKALDWAFGDNARYIVSCVCKK